MASLQDITNQGQSNMQNRQTQDLQVDDPNARAAEQNFQDELTGKNGFNSGRGYQDMPSYKKGRVSYDQIREQSLQNYYKNQLHKNATDNYNNFDPTKYAQGETAVARRNMAQNVMNSQKTIRANASAAGMLHSGRRQMGEALVGQQADQDFQKYQQDLVNSSFQKKQDLAAAMIAPTQAKTSADLNTALQSAQMASAANQQQSQLAGAGLGLLGSGVGNYYGSRPPAVTPTPAAVTPTVSRGNATVTG
jgi:hypothetical protein